MQRWRFQCLDWIRALDRVRAVLCLSANFRGLASPRIFRPVFLKYQTAIVNPRVEMSR